MGVKGYLEGGKAVGKASLKMLKELGLARNLDPSQAARMARADEQLYSPVVVHGTNRLDRLLDKPGLDPRRATSGPMPFFTDATEVGSNYAKGKQDTSLAYEDGEFSNWFKIKAGRGKEKNLDTVWWSLSDAEKQQLSENLGKITLDDNGSLVFGEGPGGKAHWDWSLKEARGNPIQAAKDIWLNSGLIFNEEEKFIDVLKAAGLQSPVRYNSPNISQPGMLAARLRITNPLDTSSPESMQGVLSALEQASKGKRYKQYNRGADQWDKNNIGIREFTDRLRDDLGNGTTHAWTSIPDAVTVELKKLGYDGIIDAGGKNGGMGHKVYIPFDANQVRSVNAMFDPEKQSSSDLLAGVAGVMPYAGATAALLAGATPQEAEAGTLSSGVRFIKNLKGAKIEAPRIFYRGVRGGGDLSVSGRQGWDSHLFAASDVEKAKLYGDNITTITAKPEAKILYEGTAEWRKVAGAWRKDESLLDYADRASEAAKKAGYDAAWFKRQGDAGTTIFNKDAFDFSGYAGTGSTGPLSLAAAAGLGAMAAGSSNEAEAGTLQTLGRAAPYLTSAALGGAAALQSGDAEAAIWGKPIPYILDAMKTGKKFLFHSGDASLAEDIAKYGIQPQHGPWIKEVLSGSVDDVDEFLSGAPEAAWYSDSPDWVRIKASRASGKPYADITDSDVEQYGHLSIVDPSEQFQEGAEFYRMPSQMEGEYTQVTDLYNDPEFGTNAPQKLYSTPLSSEDNFGNRKMVEGLEPNDIVTTESIDPVTTLTGAELLDFLAQYKAMQGYATPALLGATAVGTGAGMYAASPEQAQAYNDYIRDEMEARTAADKFAQMRGSKAGYWEARRQELLDMVNGLGALAQESPLLASAGNPLIRYGIDKVRAVTDPYVNDAIDRPLRAVLAGAGALANVATGENLATVGQNAQQVWNRDSLETTGNLGDQAADWIMRQGESASPNPLQEGAAELARFGLKWIPQVASPI